MSKTPNKAQSQARQSRLGEGDLQGTNLKREPAQQTSGPTGDPRDRQARTPQGNPMPSRQGTGQISERRFTKPGSERRRGKDDVEKVIRFAEKPTRVRLKKDIYWGRTPGAEQVHKAGKIINDYVGAISEKAMEVIGQPKATKPPSQEDYRRRALETHKNSFDPGLSDEDREAMGVSEEDDFEDRGKGNETSERGDLDGLDDA
jgi:hypothetical protein